MRTDVTRQSFASVMLLFVVLTGLLWMRAAVAPAAAEGALPGDVALGGIVSDGLAGMPFAAGALSLLLLTINAVRVARIAARNMLYVTRTFVPILFYLVAACGIFLTPGNVNGMLTAFFFAWGSQYLIDSFRRSAGFDLLFRGGFLLGLMPLFYPPAIVLWTGVPAAVTLFRRSWREAAVCMAGLLLPAALCSYVYWLCGQEFSAPALQIVDYLGLGQPYAPLGIGPGQMVLLCLLTLAVFLAVGTYAGMARSMRTRPARIVLYFICMLAASLVIFALPCRNAMAYPLLATGVAAIAPIYFVKKPGLPSALLYILLLLCTVLANIFPVIL